MAHRFYETKKLRSKKIRLSAYKKKYMGLCLRFHKNKCRKIISYIKMILEFFV